MKIFNHEGHKGYEGRKTRRIKKTFVGLRALRGEKPGLPR
jgi:hypothetical protein